MVPENMLSPGFDTVGGVGACVGGVGAVSEQCRYDTVGAGSGGVRGVGAGQRWEDVRPGHRGAASLWSVRPTAGY